MLRKLYLVRTLLVVLMFQGVGLYASGFNSCQDLLADDFARRNSFLQSKIFGKDLKQVEKQLMMYAIKELPPALAIYSSVPKHLKQETQAKLFFQEIKEINPNWAALALHPGIFQRRSEFIQFSQSVEKNLSAKEIYFQFRDKLGFRIMYRGLALASTQEVKAVKNHGLFATSIKRDLYQEGQPLVTYQQQIINRETMKNPEQDHLISVSEFPELAYALATSFGDPSSHTFVAVFKIRVPILDLIDAGSNGLVPMTMFSGQLKFKGLLQSGKHFEEVVDERIESFVPFTITPDEIIDVQIYKDGQIGKSSGIKIVPNNSN